MSSEPETTLQPSLHTISEYVDMVLDEAECRDIDVSDLRAEFDSDPDGEFINEIIDETLSRLFDAGYASAEMDDTLIVMPKDVPLSDDWQE